MDINEFTEFFLRDSCSLDDYYVRIVYKNLKNGLGKYIKLDTNDNFVLKEGCSLDTYVSDEGKSLRNILEDIVAENEKVKDAFQSFDLEEFVLRKVKYQIAIEVVKGWYDEWSKGKDAVTAG